jgi:hypothetical protein
MTIEEALEKMAELLPGRVVVAEQKGQSFRVGFTDDEFNYWMGASDMGYGMALIHAERRIKRR